MVTFAELIRKKREEKGMSVYELARRARVGYRVVYGLENGIQEETSIYKAIKLCKVLEIPAYMLMELEGKDD